MSLLRTQSAAAPRAADLRERACYRPLLAVDWGRALIAGLVAGMVPVALVAWLFFDDTFANLANEETFRGYRFYLKLGLLGDALPWLVLAVAIWMVGHWRRRSDICGWATFLFLAIAASGIAVNLLKLVFTRMRPNWHGVVPQGGSYSFPSGHSVTIGAIAVVLTLRWPRFFPVALLLVALVAVNRVVSFNHHLTDVIVGLILGMLSTLVLEWGWWRYLPDSFRLLRRE
jgi:membrane-associated phospholipid phosphatase